MVNWGRQQVGGGCPLPACLPANTPLSLCQQVQVTLSLPMIVPLIVLPGVDLSEPAVQLQPKGRPPVKHLNRLHKPVANQHTPRH